MIIASLIWAFSFGIARGLAGQVDPYQLSTLRILLATIVAFFVTKVFFRHHTVSKDAAFRFFLVGFIQLGLMYGPYMLSFQHLKAHEVALFTMTSPLYFVLLEQTVKRSFNLKTLFAALLAVVGGSTVVWQKIDSQSLWMGVMLVQLSNLLFVWGQWLIVSFQPSNNELYKSALPHYFCGGLIGSALCFVFFSQGHFSDLFHLTKNVWIEISYLGVVSTGIGFFLWNYGAPRVTAAQLAVAMDYKLPLAIVVSLLVFGETANVLQVFLGIMILMAATWMVRRFC